MNMTSSASSEEGQKLSTDSPVSHRIVRSFLQFLNSVEPAPGVDLESLDVVKDCLHEVFQLNQSSIDDRTELHSLVEYFRSRDANERAKLSLSHTTTPMEEPSTSSTCDIKAKNPVQASESMADGTRDESLGVSKDELFVRFFSSLDRIHFFKMNNNGEEDQTQVEKATRLFHEALQELERSGCKTMESADLAETFKSRGNNAMQGKLYSDAIELYTYSIALSEENAIYYCNRAAAYTQVHNYMEAIRDCQKSSQIDPNYSKAYSRLGLAYYAQGNYRDALEKGFYKALTLDPNSESIKENIQVATLKMHTERDQGAGGGSGNHSASARFSTTIPIHGGEMSINLGDLLRNATANMSTNMHQGQDRPPHAENNSNTGGSESSGEPGMRSTGSHEIDRNMNFEENVAEEFMGTFRSVMGMFSGAQPHQGAQHSPQNPQPDAHSRQGAQQHPNPNADAHGEGSSPT